MYIFFGQKCKFPLCCTFLLRQWSSGRRFLHKASVLSDVLSESFAIRALLCSYKRWIINRHSKFYCFSVTGFASRLTPLPSQLILIELFCWDCGANSYFRLWGLPVNLPPWNSTLYKFIQPLSHSSHTCVTNSPYLTAAYAVWTPQRVRVFCPAVLEAFSIFHCQDSISLGDQFRLFRPLSPRSRVNSNSPSRYLLKFFCEALVTSSNTAPPEFSFLKNFFSWISFETVDSADLD